jgi:hypothetical protein
MPPSDGGCASRCRRPRKLRRLKRKYAWSYKKLASFSGKTISPEKVRLTCITFSEGWQGESRGHHLTSAPGFRARAQQPGHRQALPVLAGMADLDEADSREAKGLLVANNLGHWEPALEAAGVLHLHAMFQVRSLVDCGPAAGAFTALLAKISALPDAQKPGLPVAAADQKAELLTVIDVYRGARKASMERRGRAVSENAAAAPSSGGAPAGSKKARDEAALKALRSIWKTQCGGNAAFEGREPDDAAILAVHASIQEMKLPPWKVLAEHADKDAASDEDDDDDDGAERPPSAEESMATFTAVTYALGLGCSTPTVGGMKTGPRDVDVTIGGKVVKLVVTPPCLTHLRTATAKARRRAELGSMATRNLVKAVYAYLRDTFGRNETTLTEVVGTLLDTPAGIDSLAFLANERAKKVIQARRKAQEEKSKEKKRKATASKEKGAGPSSDGKKAKGPASSGRACSAYKVGRCAHGSKCIHLHISGSEIVNSPKKAAAEGEE